MISFYKFNELLNEAKSTKKNYLNESGERDDFFLPSAQPTDLSKSLEKRAEDDEAMSRQSFKKAIPASSRKKSKVLQRQDPNQSLSNTPDRTKNMSYNERDHAFITRLTEFNFFLNLQGTKRINREFLAWVVKKDFPELMDKIQWGDEEINFTTSKESGKDGAVILPKPKIIDILDKLHVLKDEYEDKRHVSIKLPDNRVKRGARIQQDYKASFSDKMAAKDIADAETDYSTVQHGDIIRQMPMLKEKLLKAHNLAPKIEQILNRLAKTSIFFGKAMSADDFNQSIKKHIKMGFDIEKVAYEINKFADVKIIEVSEEDGKVVYKLKIGNLAKRSNPTSSMYLRKMATEMKQLCEMLRDGKINGSGNIYKDFESVHKVAEEIVDASPKVRDDKFK